MDGITAIVEQEGLNEMRVNFNALRPKLKRSINRKALRKAAQPVLKLAKAGISVDTALTRRNLRIAVTVTDYKGEASVGVRRKGSRGRASLVHLIEDHKPFLRPALVGGRMLAIRRYGEVVKEEIERTLPRAS